MLGSHSPFQWIDPPALFVSDNSKKRIRSGWKYHQSSSIFKSANNRNMPSKLMQHNEHKGSLFMVKKNDGSQLQKANVTCTTSTLNNCFCILSWIKTLHHIFNNIYIIASRERERNYINFWFVAFQSPIDRFYEMACQQSPCGYKKLILQSMDFINATNCNPQFQQFMYIFAAA